MGLFWRFLRGKAGEKNWLFWLDAERIKYYSLPTDQQRYDGMAKAWGRVQAHTQDSMFQNLSLYPLVRPGVGVHEAIQCLCKCFLSGSLKPIMVILR